MPLQLQTKDGRVFDYNSDVYNSISDYKWGTKEYGTRGSNIISIMDQFFARDIDSNTFTVNKTDAMAGDMAITTQPYGHIVVFNQVNGTTAADRKVSYGNFTSDGRNTIISYNKRDWTNSKMDGNKNPIV